MAIERIDMGARLVLLSDGTTLPLINAFDDNGDETDNLADVDSIICGYGERFYAAILGNRLKAQLRKPLDA